MAPSQSPYSEKVPFFDDAPEADISLESTGSGDRFNSFARGVSLNEQRGCLGLPRLWKAVGVLGVFILGSGLGHLGSSYVPTNALLAGDVPTEALAACSTQAAVAESAVAVEPVVAVESTAAPPLSSQILPVDDSDASLAFHNSFFPATLDGCAALTGGPPAFDSELRRTALASFPRSGNTWTRNLLERSTGYETGTVYDEAKANYSWIVKTHGAQTQSFQRALVLVRNPMDVLFSYFNFYAISKAGGDSFAKNTGRVNITLLGDEPFQHAKAVAFAKRWVTFYDFWIDSARVPHHLIRYEDMRQNPVSWLLSALSFVLPDHMPTLPHVACALANMPDRESYESRRLENFGTWELWNPKTRNEVLAIVKPWMCRFDYAEMLRKTHGYEMQC